MLVRVKNHTPRHPEDFPSKRRKRIMEIFHTTSVGRLLLTVPPEATVAKS
jgi:hypothetical protein